MFTHFKSSTLKTRFFDIFSTALSITRGETILERLGGARFLQQFEFPALFSNEFPTVKCAGNSNCCKNRETPSLSNIIFPLVQESS